MNHLPYDPGKIIEVEAALIGACIAHPDGTKKWPTLSPDEFYKEHHRLIWQAMLDLMELTESPDLLALVVHMRSRKSRGVTELAEIGGEAVLAHLADAGTMVLDLGHYGRLVRLEAKKRKRI